MSASDIYVNPNPTCLSKDLYLDTETADVFFEVKSRETSEFICIPAHKCFLIEASPVFEKMFCGPLKETGKILITDVCAEGFKEFLQFFYVNELKFTIENSIDVFHLIKKYDIGKLFEIFVQFLLTKLNIDDVCWAYEQAIFFKHGQLKQYCEEIIRTYPEEILKSDSFKECDQSTLYCILNLRLLCREIVVFCAIYTWAVAACKNENLNQTLSTNLRGKLKEKLLYRIRYDHISQEDYTTNRQLFENLFESNELFEIRLNIGVADLLQEREIGCTLDYTKFNPRPLQIIRWNENFLLVCKRTLGVSRIAYPLQRIERAIFSSNKPILWRGFVCGELSLHNKSSLGEVPVRVTVIRKPNETFFPNGANDILHMIEVSLSAFRDTLIQLPNAIVVKPKTQYEIQIEKLIDRPYYANHIFDREKNVHDVKIEFQQHEAGDSLVTAFHFNLIF